MLHAMNVERTLYDDPASREKARLRALADIKEGRTVSHAEVAERLRLAAESLAEFPHKGREIDHGLRQWGIVRPYLVRYLIDGDHAFIVDIVHGAQWPRAEEPE